MYKPIVLVTIMATANPIDAASYVRRGTLDELITEYDPFYLPHEKDEMCGGIRPLTDIRPYFNRYNFASLYPDEYTIHDDVVMDYWEHRDDESYWTPLCGARHDTVRR